MMRIILVLCLCVLFGKPLGAQDEQTPKADTQVIRIGSKLFTESVILGELVSHLCEDAGVQAEHREQLGGTRVLWNSLLSGEIDVYPEYSGTLIEEILKEKNVSSDAEIEGELAAQGIRMSRPLGFNNTYALGMKESTAKKYGIRKISDLKKNPELKFGFSNEFMERDDGWPNLKRTYQLPQTDVRGLNHDLAYRGLEGDSIDLIDLYSTDAEIAHYKLRVLEDDKSYFPGYQALFLYRADLEERFPRVVESILKLEGAIPEARMISMNHRVKLMQVPETVVAADFLKEAFAIEADAEVESRGERLLRYTREHLYLVVISMIATIVIAVPLGIVSYRYPLTGQIVLGVVGILQTIPSLALLVLVIPFLGLGAKPAIFALFLYSLLPIVRNTHAGLVGIPRHMHESAEALGLSAGARLRLIELPLASRSILAGIKTAVVINVGTATLGAFIGAGGFGQPILRGIRLAQTDLLLEGAVPAALMALVAQGIFELCERYLVPRGLRLKTEG